MRLFLAASALRQRDRVTQRATHLVPDDRVVGADAIQAGEEGEDSVDEERDLRLEVA